MKSSRAHRITSGRGRAWALALVVPLVVACSSGGAPQIPDPGQPQDPEPAPVIADGEVFAMVTVGVDEQGATTLNVDTAEMLTGEEARQKAIADGVIAEEEDLPNDFYIANDEEVYVQLALVADPEITVISGTDTSQRLEIGSDQLVALWEGEYTGEPVYGIIPSTPIPMEVTVTGGLISSARAVYLP